MPTYLWNFETLTTTGYEGDLDVNHGLVMLPVGNGPPADNQATPFPSVPGHTGNGRLCSSAGHYSGFSTNKVTDLAWTAGNPISLSFWWRPLVEYGFVTPQSMFGWNVLGFDITGAIGTFAIDVSINSTTTPALYNFVATRLGGIPTTLTPVSMTLRDWHHIEMIYDGSTGAEFFVDGVSIGTLAYGGTSSFPKGVLNFAGQAGSSPAVYGVLDTVEFTLS